VREFTLIHFGDSSTSVPGGRRLLDQANRLLPQIRLKAAATSTTLTIAIITQPKS